MQRIAQLPWMRRALLRLLLTTLLWWVLADGAAGSWYIGVPAVLLATAASLRWSGTSVHSLRPTALLPFAIHFLRSSLVAGVDVARRALAPSLPVAPALVRIDTKLPAGAPRWLLALTISLVPGSLMVTMEDNRLLLHSLDHARDSERDVRKLERLIAPLFGLSTAGAA